MGSVTGVKLNEFYPPQSLPEILTLKGMGREEEPKP